MSAAIRAQTKSNAATHNLWQIAGTCDVGQLEQVLARGADVNASDRSGMTALMRAAYHGQLQMVRALIEHGANLNAMDRDGLTALMLARHSGREDIVTTLVSYGVEEAPKARVSESSAVRAVQAALRMRLLCDGRTLRVGLHPVRSSLSHKRPPHRRINSRQPSRRKLTLLIAPSSLSRRGPRRRRINSRKLRLWAMSEVFVPLIQIFRSGLLLHCQ